MGLGGILALSHLVSRRSVRAGFALELIAIFSTWHMCKKNVIEVEDLPLQFTYLPAPCPIV